MCVTNQIKQLTLEPCRTPSPPGEFDRIVPPRGALALAAELPNASTAVLPDCGHLSHEEAPQALLDQLVPFCGHVLGGEGLGLGLLGPFGGGGGAAYGGGGGGGGSYSGVQFGGKGFGRAG